MMQMLSTRVLVLPDPRQKSRAGILLPDNAQKKPVEGHVIAVGDGRILDNGTEVPIKVKPGHRVLYSKYGGNEVDVDGIEHIILDIESIYAILYPLEKATLVRFKIIGGIDSKIAKKYKGKLGAIVYQPDENIFKQDLTTCKPKELTKGRVLMFPKIQYSAGEEPVEGLHGRVMEVGPVPDNFSPLLDAGIKG